MAKSPATYYVRFDTFWQNSPDRWAGPFATRKQAEGAIGEALHSDDTCAVMNGWNPRDIKHAIRIFGVFSKTQAIRKGMKDYSQYPHSNLVGTRVPVSTDDLFEMENADNEPTDSRGLYAYNFKI